MNIQKRFKVILAIIVCSFAFAVPGNSAEFKIPPIKGLYISPAGLSIKDEKVVLNIDKNAYLLLKVPHLSQLNIKYSTDSTFLIRYTTIIEPVYVIKPHMLFSMKVRKGDGELHINLKDTINWEYDSYPFLIIEGTGKLVFEQVSGFVTSDRLSIKKEKDRAFFWRPEQVRPMTMNSLSPVYWSYTRGYLWPDVLAIFFCVIAIPVTFILYLNGRDFRKAFTIISIITVIIFNVHFLIRFLPIVNVGFYLPNQEKIRQYYFREDFGNLVAKARETVHSSDKVAFMGAERDWFSKEALCFNLAPTPCVYYKPEIQKLTGLMDVYGIRSSDINIVVSYNSDYPLPPGFKKIITFNKNSFIAGKK